MSAFQWAQRNRQVGHRVSRCMSEIICHVSVNRWRAYRVAHIAWRVQKYSDFFRQLAREMFGRFGEWSPFSFSKGQSGYQISSSSPPRPWPLPLANLDDPLLQRLHFCASFADAMLLSRGRGIAGLCSRSLASWKLPGRAHDPSCPAALGIHVFHCPVSFFSFFFLVLIGLEGKYRGF